jgi:hypothetical protein
MHSIAIALALSLLAAGCAGDPKASGTDFASPGATPTPASATAPASSPAGLNRKYSLGGFGYTVTAVEAPAAVAGNTPTAGAAFVIVSYSVVNEGKKGEMVTISDVELVDAQDRQFTPAFHPTVDKARSLNLDAQLSELQPGIPKNFVQVFELPEAAAKAGPLRLKVDSQEFSSEESVLIPVR